jgi:hypothetical protein
LISAAFWNYLREDITIALIERRPLMIELSAEHIPQELKDDDDYANYVTVLLGQVINQCFRREAGAFDSFKWTSLRSDLEKWGAGLPTSFQPITSHQQEDSQRALPFMWTFQGWHGRWRSRAVREIHSSAVY